MATVETSSLTSERNGDLFADKFRELLNSVRANRPNDDPEIIR